MRALPLVTFLAALPFLGSCGGGSSPASPAARAPLPTPRPVPAPTFFDGGTDQPVNAQATPALPGLRQPVSVRGTGFLLREQLFSGDPIHLWPADDDYVGEFVYGWHFSDGTYRMVRWASGFTVSLDGELAEEEAIVAKTREVVEEMRRVTGLDIEVGSGGACVISLDSNLVTSDDAVGETRLKFRGSTITAADVVFVNRKELTGGAGSDYRNTLLHEMGHVLGLRHSPDDHEVMAAGGYANAGSKVGQFQAGEGTALRVMYFYRKAGNFPPTATPTWAYARRPRPRR